MATESSVQHGARDERTRDAIRDLPPSAKLVAKALELEGPLTQSQLIQETYLARRTVRYALKRLEEADVLHTRPALSDARQKLYALEPPNDSS